MMAGSERGDEEVESLGHFPAVGPDEPLHVFTSPLAIGHHLRNTGTCHEGLYSLERPPPRAGRGRRQTKAEGSALLGTGLTGLTGLADLDGTGVRRRLGLTGLGRGRRRTPGRAPQTPRQLGLVRHAESRLEHPEKQLIGLSEVPERAVLGDLRSLGFALFAGHVVDGLAERLGPRLELGHEELRRHRDTVDLRSRQLQAGTAQMRHQALRLAQQRQRIGRDLALVAHFLGLLRTEHRAEETARVDQDPAQSRDRLVTAPAIAGVVGELVEMRLFGLHEHVQRGSQPPQQSIDERQHVRRRLALGDVLAENPDEGLSQLFAVGLHEPLRELALLLVDRNRLVDSGDSHVHHLLSTFSQ